MTQSPTGGPAQTIYQTTSRQGVIGRDAQRVVIVTDGRPQEGGPQQAAYFVSDAEIAAGEFIVTGNKPLPIVTVGAAGAEYPPIAVYDVTGQPDDVQPAQPSNDPIGDALRADAVAYYLFGIDSNDSTNNHLDLAGYDESFFLIFSDEWAAPNVDGGGAFRDNVPQIAFGDTDFTVTYEFRRDSLDYGFTVTAFATGTNPFELDVEVLASLGNGFFIKQANGGNDISTGTGGDPITGTGMHLLIAWYRASDQSVHLSLDNQADNSATPPAPVTMTPGTVSLQISGTAGFNIRRLGIYDRVLSSDERDYLWNSGAGRALFPAP